MKLASISKWKVYQIKMYATFLIEPDVISRVLNKQRPLNIANEWHILETLLTMFWVRFLPMTE